MNGASTRRRLPRNWSGTAPARSLLALLYPNRPWRKALGRALAGCGLLLLAFLSGLAWFAATIPTEIADSDSPTDAIVVLTGGPQRVATGLALLAEGKAGKLFISGVHPGVELADLLRTVPPQPGWIGCCVVLGHSAGNTIGNAAETAGWMRAEGFHSLRLVTGSYHMRRSLLELHRAMPDVRIIPHPVLPNPSRPADWEKWRHDAGLVVTEYVKYLAALARLAVAGTAHAPVQLPSHEFPSGDAFA
jgi:uncharacterized SAM-binding protein YcdF (DUF218 family)